MTEVLPIGSESTCSWRPVSARLGRCLLESARAGSRNLRQFAAAPAHVSTRIAVSCSDRPPDAAAGSRSAALVVWPFRPRSACPYQRPCATYRQRALAWLFKPLSGLAAQSSLDPIWLALTRTSSAGCVLPRTPFTVSPSAMIRAVYPSYHTLVVSCSFVRIASSASIALRWLIRA